MVTVIVFFLVLSLLVIIHELGHFAAAKLQGIKVEEFGFGIPPRIFGVRYGETLYSINALPFGGFVKVFGEEEAQLEGRQLTDEEKKRSFVHKSYPGKIAVLVAGVLLNFILGWVIVSYLFTQGVPVPTDRVVIQEVVENSPASNAGLKAGDEITQITTPDGVVEVDASEDISSTARTYAGEIITLTVARDSGQVNYALIPRKDPPEGQGSLGVLITNYEIKKYSIVEAPVLGLVESAKITGIIARELGKLFVTLITFNKPEADIAGPVGIAQLTGQAAQQGLQSLLQLIGLLSLNLAVINILPFPALDGGRLAFVLYEWGTGRKINPKIEQRLNFIGFAFLIGVLILVTINDIIKLFIT